MVVGMASARTVNLSHLASEMPSDAQIASSYRRQQRFFQHVDLGPDWSARLVVELLSLVCMVPGIFVLIGPTGRLAAMILISLFWRLLCGVSACP